MKRVRLLRGDRGIWAMFILLSVISLVGVYTSIGLYAYSNFSSKTPTALFLRHLIIVCATYVAMIVISHINYRTFSRFALLAYWVTLVLLGVMFVLRKRWLHVPLIGQFQPSEVAKIVLIIFVARLLSLKKDQLNELGTFIQLLFVIALPVALVLPGNFSMAALIFLVCFLMMLLGGVNRKYWWRVMLVGLLLVGVYLTTTYKRYEKSINTGQAAVEYGIGREPTWGHRLYAWVNPQPDELTQENMARMAIARGGLVGAGVGNTVHARLMTQAHNDFIYAIIIEETGLLGGLVVFIIYSVLYFRCVKLTWRCKGRFGALTVTGIGTVIYLQAILNMCVAVGVLPVTGQTLPFVSFGGTAYLLMGCGLGVIQSIANDVNAKEREQQQAVAAAAATDKTANNESNN
ncbi:MAG: FtsW/RodA/SpoVE family cell cycle protein [Bacteroidales bacterium]|nr:FtsW/RodA/SpoVE family cell cycle protein [Bacteroidales bacterium]